MRLEYKNYIGSVEFSSEDNCYYGKLLGIKDLVTYEAPTKIELQKEFQDAVDDYLDFCNEVNNDITL